jgi:hypothetical protein
MGTALRKRSLSSIDRSPLLTGTLLLLITTSCGVTRTGRTGSLPTDAGSGSSRLPAPLVEKMKRAVEGEISQHVEDAQAAVLTTLAEAGSIPAHFRHALVLDTLTAPWSGMTALERQGT